MVNETAAIQVEVVYSDDRTHRYLIKRTWDAKKPHTCIIMQSPSPVADTIAMDMTSMYTISNAHRKDFGAVSIMNIFSNMYTKRESNQDNDDMLVKICKEADSVILAWGKGDLTKQTAERLEELYKLLKPFSKKLMVISDGEDSGFHPLAKTVRLGWELVPFKVPKTEKVLE